MEHGRELATKYQLSCALSIELSVVSWALHRILGHCPLQPVIPEAAPHAAYRQALLFLHHRVVHAWQCAGAMHRIR